MRTATASCLALIPLVAAVAGRAATARAAGRPENSCVAARQAFLNPDNTAFTTSFLSICGNVKDNRLLPHGFLTAAERVAIAGALGAGPDLAEEAGPHAIGDDPDYGSGGGDSVVYRVDLSAVVGTPSAVTATLYYQATPPFFLQDRFCTSRSEATERLDFLTGHVNLDGTDAEGWKLEVVATGTVPVRVP